MSKYLVLIVACFLLHGEFGKASADAPPAVEPKQTEQPKTDVAAILKRLENGDPNSILQGLNELHRLEKVALFGDRKLDAIAHCARLMQSKNGEVASRACDVLSRFDADAVPLLIKAFQAKDPVLQSRAARALGSIASGNKPQLTKMDAAIPHLAKLLHSDGKEARHNAFYAISAMGPKAIPHMIRALDAEDYFQRVMMEGFVRHGEKSVQPLCEALRTGGVTTRRSAGYMLFFISWRAPDVLPVLESKALKALTDAIEDDDQLVRSRAIETLGRMKGRAKSSLDNIVAALKQPDPPYLSIADAAHRIGPEVRHIDDLLDGVRRMTAKPADDDRAAWKFGEAVGAAGKEGVDHLIRALGDRRKVVQKTALVALFRLGPEAAPAVPAIIRQLNNGDPFAPDVLAAIGPKAAEAIPHLVSRQAKDDWYRPRRSLPKHLPRHYSKSADALTAIGPAAVPALLKGLKHENDLVRAGCLIALGNMDAKAMVPLPAMGRLCRDEHPTVRELAFLAIIQQAGEDKQLAISAFQKLQNDKNPGVAEAAKYHVGKLREQGD